ncbi:hypothetical protein PYW07_008928 [Mythimna separata]|uniref:Kazal-like domain-containing protein n=1 Tax=Mythimna separata TaxID=271217 RepID=A0AAD7YAM2_MYTSE|nr:hypothetical protein PYW07_008928 [Mythimna separata]
MRPLVIAFGLLAVAAYSNMANIDTLGNGKFVVKPIGRITANRDMDNEESSLESFTSFIEEKLMHQNQALEHLIKSVDASGDMIKKLIDNLSKGLEKPTMPTKAEVEDTSQPGSRRSLGDDPVHSPSQQSDDKKVNPWCPMALLCQKIEDPVCGFDDEFGYGRFENFCHLLRVNCYWKYNFSVVSSCRPKL